MSLQIPRLATSVVVLSALLMAAPGCGDDGGNATTSTDGGSGPGGGGSGGAGGDGGVGAGTTGGTGNTGNEWNCEEGPGYNNGPEIQSVTSLQGTVTDLAGAPVEGIAAQCCGVDICLVGFTNASGIVQITETADINKPKFKVGDGLSYAKFALPVPDTAQITVSAVLPALTNSSEALEPGAMVSAGGVELSLAADAQVDINIIEFSTPADQTFRAAIVPEAQIEEVVGDQGFDMLFVTSPIDTHFCPAAQVTIPNNAGFEAGAAVDFIAHGVSISEEWAAYGGWAKVSGGVVSEDGLTISTNPDEGLPILTAYGVVLAE